MLTSVFFFFCVKVTLNLLKETSTAIKKIVVKLSKILFNLKFVEINLMNALSARKIRNKYQLF